MIHPLLLANAAPSGGGGSQARTAGAVIKTAVTGGGAWGPFGNPDLTVANVEADDGSTADALVQDSANNHSDYGVLSDFGFSIPGGATILGVLVETIGCDSAHGGRYARWKGVWLTTDGVNPDGSSSNEADATEFNSGDGLDLSHGGAANTFSMALTPAIVNDTSFGCAIQGERYAAIGSGGNTRLRFDHLRMTVYHT